MDISELTFSKKPEQIKVLKWDAFPFRKDHIYIADIKPSTMIKKGIAYDITFIDRSLILKGFTITTYSKEDKIITINIYGEHPNCDLETNTFCWPYYKKGLPLDQKSFSSIFRNLQTYYLDDCHFTPASHLVEYKRLDSMNIRLSKGE